MSVVISLPESDAEKVNKLFDNACKLLWTSVQVEIINNKIVIKNVNKLINDADKVIEIMQEAKKLLKENETRA